MTTQETHAVTGAFGYSGSYIASRLLALGHRVRTLTNSGDRKNQFDRALDVHPFHFGDRKKLTESLEGVKVLYNTYWVRFNHKTFTHAQAVRNTFELFRCAKAAGVERVVHVSITNPSKGSRLEYFSGKAAMEENLRETGLSYSILRPAVIFGGEDILVNNIAWGLRTLPVFGVFGDGEYKIQPIYVDDLAQLAVEQGQSRDNVVIDAIGPETFTYKGLVETVGTIIGKERKIISVVPLVGYATAAIIGKIQGDVLLTRDEIKGLMDNLLFVNAPPAGETKLTDWAQDRAGQLGKGYTSELARRVDRASAYGANGSDLQAV